MGKPIAFLIATALVIVWASTGPLFGYSDTWQLVINTSTTIVTFLMVFLIQNTQNRDTMALQLKLSELILVISEAENRFASAEDLTEEELERLHKELQSRAQTTLGALDQSPRRAGEESELSRFSFWSNRMVGATHDQHERAGAERHEGRPGRRR